MRFRHAIAGVFLLMTQAVPALAQADVAQPGLVTADEWAIYKAGFVSDGRIVDGANGNISHSEGQGYGLLLAHLAGDAEGFDEIWRFTQEQLFIRGDGLAAWRWEADASPNVTDANNATDGDILIAYALALEGLSRNDDTLLAAARQIADAVGELTTLRWRGLDLLLPAQFGFRREDRADGPVVNLSYWVFEAFPVLARVAPGTDWQRIAQDGRRLLAGARFDETMLPADWIALPEGRPVLAEGFDPQFGYNNVRIPLYLMRAGFTQPALLEPFITSFADDPAIVDLRDGSAIEPLSEPGYQAIAAALHCVADGTPLPEDLRVFSQHSYYGSTLHLLTLSYLRASAPHCL